MRFAAAALAATVLIASPASAATIVQTVVNNNGPAYVQGFDPQVGTLNSVTVASSYFAWYYFEYASQLDDPVINVNGILGSPIFGTVDVSGLYQATRQGFNMIGVRLSGNATATTTSAFSPFYSPLVALLGGLQNGSFTVDGQPLKQTVPSFPGQAGGRFTVTYNYTPAVPEPTSWALMLAGFAMTGYALRRRRATVAFA